MTAVTEDAFRKEDVAIEVLQELQEELAKVSFDSLFHIGK